MPKQPRHRSDYPKQGRGRARPWKNETATGANGASRAAAPVGEVQANGTGIDPATKLDNPVPEARERVSNAGGRQQSAKRRSPAGSVMAHKEGGKERVSARGAARAKRRHSERSGTRDGAAAGANESEQSDRRRRNDRRGDAAMPNTSQVPPRKFDLMSASGLSDEAR
jgi:hypothetical protein